MFVDNDDIIIVDIVCHGTPALWSLITENSLKRYDKLSKNFYNKVQISFLHLAKKNKKKYLTINTNKNPRLVQTLILKRVLNIVQVMQLSF